MRQMSRFRAALLTALLTAASAAAQTPRKVEVLNFPEVQKIRGPVEVLKPISHSAFVRREREIVSPTSRRDAIRREPVGTLETQGFTSVVLSLQGEMKGTVSEGVVGALLIPEEKAILQALREDEVLLFPLEIRTGISDKTAYFTSQKKLPVGFPRYRIFLFNSAEVSAEVNLYIYLTH